jgi:hypothetical protein
MDTVAKIRKISEPDSGIPDLRAVPLSELIAVNAEMLGRILPDTGGSSVPVASFGSFI